MSGPLLAGAVQVTFKLVSDTAVTLGRAGRPGVSTISVMVTSTDTVSVPPLPSSACTEKSGSSSRSS